MEALFLSITFSFICLLGAEASARIPCFLSSKHCVRQKAVIGPVLCGKSLNKESTDKNQGADLVASKVEFLTAPSTSKEIFVSLADIFFGARIYVFRSGLSPPKLNS